MRNFSFEMWRIELLHPVLVHFPVALLITAFAIELAAALVFRQRWNRELRFCSALLAVLGALGAIAAVVSGDVAHSIVNRVICDPSVTHQHEEWGERVMWLSILTAGIAVWRLRKERSRWVTAGLLTLMAVGCVMLGYTAHLGGTLVYQQGAAVYRTSEQCTEFE